jgi:putative ABC transport system permease protein
MGATPAQQPVMTIVGVVARVKMERLDEQGGAVQAYLPMLQAPIPRQAVLLKTTLEAETLTTAARQQVLAVDSQQPIYDLRTLSELRDNSFKPERLNLTLLGSFACMALLLAAIGLYGVISYVTAHRSQEIGIRMALGARRRDVLKLIVRQGMTLAFAGAALGLLASLALARLMKTLLFGVSATDPLTFGGVALLLLGVALLACWIPARRATRVDPMIALRCE